ncbi:MAG: CPBP family intramembrane metalloprotease [Phycisphaerae bacterium]|nr:CPBP family intramembrane metalloprotease [Phycisphaerae bacterium]
MTALLLLALVPAVMWVGQTAVLRRSGLPVRWRIDARHAPRHVRTVGRITTQLSLLAIIVAYPLILGGSPVAYYGALLPVSGSAWHVAQGAAASVLFLCVLFGVWLATGRLQIDVYQSRRRWRRRLLLLLPTALLGALTEELLFRGVVMADLLRSLPDATYLAVTLAALTFAVAHYVRSPKRYWTFPGHVMLGLLLCVAFLQTGSLWLAVGLHVGGILMIMGTRPFFWYRGPAWVTGASIFPFAGVVGIVGLGILTAFVATHYGVQ